MATLDGMQTPAATSSGTPADDAVSGPTEKPVNEIVEAARKAKEDEAKAAHAEEGSRNAWIAAGVGVGIGSAALVAALLYASRDKGKDKKKD